ncbi:MAG TPA: tyrosine-type recombinase/integrase [Candidatus Binatia bacterium]|nr:tyrosine-type recombinase/integrase [Candidatus Binatia bacterium]
MANRTLALVRKIFNFAVAEEIVAANPCAGIARPTAEQQRDRVLSADEIRAIWSACDHEPAWVAAAIWLYLLTAQRKDEILAMRWDEVDFGSGWWTIPAERAKNGLAHRVWLSSPAQRILKELRLRAGGSAFVFPSPRGDQPVATLQKPLDRIRKSTGVEFRIHDLRRTAASHMTGAGSRV